jgi:hypothetical protein
MQKALHDYMVRNLVLPAPQRLPTRASQSEQQQIEVHAARTRSVLSQGSDRVMSVSEIVGRMRQGIATPELLGLAINQIRLREEQRISDHQQNLSRGDPPRASPNEREGLAARHSSDAAIIARQKNVISHLVDQFQCLAGLLEQSKK